MPAKALITRCFFLCVYQSDGPNVPLAGIALQGVPFPSAVVLLTLVPHQLSVASGNVTQKKMMTADTATSESSAADKM